jgi:signal transduction histidine kinase/NO-binding membrane sensor protein with MHYT domain
MLKIYLCISTQHDWRLVLAAAVVCACATLATFFLYSKVPAFPLGRRLMWLGLTGLVAGSGIWTTHSVAMLAFKTGLPTGYTVLGALGSFGVAALCTGLGFAISSSPRLTSHRRLAALAGGVVVGLGICLTHYVGMSGYRTAGELSWNAPYVAASVLIGAILAAAALSVASPGCTGRRQWIGAALLTLGIVGMHFTGMAAVTILPDSAVAVPASLMSDPMMAACAIAGAVLIMLTVLAGAMFDAAGHSRALKHLSEAFYVMPESMCFYDADERLVVWNTRFAEDWNHTGPLVAGLAYEDMIRASIVNGGYSMSAGRESELLAERVAAFRTGNSSSELMARDGRWLRVTHRRTASGGTVTMGVDITALKQAEAAMAQARDDAQAANRIKSEFLANMSHELRTPMNGIMVMNTLMLGTNLGSQQRKFAETVQTSAEALLAILNDILDVSKLEAGKVELEEVDFSLPAVADDVIALMRPRAEEKGIAICQDLDEGAGRLLRGDPGRIRQVLLNLMSNAVKFTDGGSVLVRARSRRAADLNTLRIEIRDTGIGLTAEAKSKLFQTFQQADGSITRRFGGTGLGLSISRQLVRLMGGDIGMEDRPGGGCIFWFELVLPDAGSQQDHRQLRTA